MCERGVGPGPHTRGRQRWQRMVHCSTGAPPPSETSTLIPESGPADRHEAHATTSHSTEAPRLPADSDAFYSNPNSNSRPPVRPAWLGAAGCLAAVVGVSYVSLSGGSGGAPWATSTNTAAVSLSGTSRVASAADPTDAGATEETRLLLKALQVKYGVYGVY